MSIIEVWYSSYHQAFCDTYSAKIARKQLQWWQPINTDSRRRTQIQGRLRGNFAYDPDIYPFHIIVDAEGQCEPRAIKTGNELSSGVCWDERADTAPETRIVQKREAALASSRNLNSLQHEGKGEIRDTAWSLDGWRVVIRPNLTLKFKHDKPMNSGMLPSAKPLSNASAARILLISTLGFWKPRNLEQDVRRSKILYVTVATLIIKVSPLYSLAVRS